MEKIQSLLEQIRKKPGRGDLHNTLGNLYQQNGNAAEAIKHFLSAARLFSLPNSPSRNINKALAILRKLVRDFPDHYDPYFSLADTLRETNQQAEACKVYKSLSDLYHRDGKYLMAVSVFDKALSFEPDKPENWIRFAELNQDAGMPFHASKAFMKAATLGFKEGQGFKSVGLVVRALSLDPENAEAAELFRVLSQKGEVDEKEGLRILDLAAEVERNDQCELALSLLDLLEDSSLAGEAKAVAERIREQAGVSRNDNKKDDGDRRRSLSGDFTGIKVLVVEDEPEILLLLEQILSAQGFNLFTAGHGEKALQIFLREKPQLVISDAMLPKLHGFELCRRIKEESPLRTKVMILTAVYKKYKYKGKVQEEYNVDEYLDKPFQITEFLDAVARMAKGVRKEKHLFSSRKEKGGREFPDRLLSFLVAVRNDSDLLAKVTVFCEKKNFPLVRAKDPKELVDTLREDRPDIFLFSDPFEGIDTDIIGPLLREILGNDWTSLVMVTKDKSRMEGPPGYFDHRVFSPIDPSVLENLLNLHLSSHPAGKGSTKSSSSFEERRLESLLKTKVEKVIKSRNQLEEYYSTRFRELEAENARLRKNFPKRTSDGD